MSLDEVGALASVSELEQILVWEEGTEYQTWEVSCKFSEKVRKFCGELVDFSS